jgi:hypothetical protein
MRKLKMLNVNKLYCSVVDKMERTQEREIQACKLGIELLTLAKEGYETNDITRLQQDYTIEHSDVEIILQLLEIKPETPLEDFRRDVVLADLARSICLL